MADTNALINIEDVVTRFLHLYKKPTEDYTIYLAHACNCVRDFRLYDSNQVVTEKVSISALGIIEMPDSMVGFNDLLYPVNGEYVSFTEMATLVNTTTFTGLVEGQDSHYGEGVAILHPEDTGYGGRGAINDYNYVIDWEARRIFCEGMTSDTVILRYVSSGIETSGVTTIPEFISPMIDNYLLWKETYWVKGLERERDMRERDYTNSELKIRGFINAMTYDQWRDLLMGINTQAPQR